MLKVIFGFVILQISKLVSQVIINPLGKILGLPDSEIHKLIGLISVFIVLIGGQYLFDYLGVSNALFKLRLFALFFIVMNFIIYKRDGEKKFLDYSIGEAIGFLFLFLSI
jgi:hypothetical protein